VNFKLDENMPRRAVHVLISRGHDAVTVVDEGLRGSDDPLVARVAAQEGRVIITLDRRFADVRRHPPGQHPGILVLRLPDQSPAQVEAVLVSFLEQHNLDDMLGCIVVIEPSAVRVRRPGAESN
jgi:predicted nuclease of predicted toxin-antitoxin system